MNDSRKSRDGRAKEALILEAAMDIFVEKGWNGARMQEIADRAGINKALLHYYFRSKRNLYNRIIESVFGSFFSQIDLALADGRTFEDILRRFIDVVVDIIAARPRIPVFIMHELSIGGPNVLEVLKSSVDRKGMTLPQRMIAIIRREARAGRIRPVDGPQLMITLLGSCIYYFAAEPIVEAMIAHVQPSAGYDRQRFISQRKEAIFDVIYRGLETPASPGRK